MLKLAAHKNSNYFLGVISFLESSFPNSSDIMIAPMAIAKKTIFKNFFNCNNFSIQVSLVTLLVHFLISQSKY